MTTFEQRQQHNALKVPSYMQPTRSSKMKENLYGTEFKFTPKRSTMVDSPPPPEHGLDYIPPRPSSPGRPRFMKPTSTSQRKTADAARRCPGRSSHKKSYMHESSSRFDLYGMVGSVSHHVHTPAAHLDHERIESHTCKPPSSGYLSWKDEIAKEQRRRCYSHMTPNPSLLGSFEAPPCVSRKSTGMDEHKKSLIQTAPAPDTYYEESSDSHMSTVGPSTPSLGTPRRPRNIPRYMLPTTSSAARFKQ